MSPLIGMMGRGCKDLSEFRGTYPLISTLKGNGAQFLPGFRGISPPLSPTMGIETGHKPSFKLGACI